MSDPIHLSRAVLRISGADARDFLQNLVTNDLDRLESAPVVYAGLLSPQGKVIADFFLWRTDEGVVLEADASRGPDLLKRLVLYRLRARVDISDISAETSVHVQFERPDGGLAAPDPRLAALGWRTLNHRALGRAGGGDPTEYETLRIMAGVPNLATDAAPEEVFALEALFEELNGVDFAKGCFVGQENVSRMKRRATTRRKFCRLATDGEAERGAPVLAGDTEIGSVRAARPNAALALLRLDRAMEAGKLTIGGARARLDPPDWLILPSQEGA